MFYNIITFTYGIKYRIAFILERPFIHSYKDVWLDLGENSWYFESSIFLFFGHILPWLQDYKTFIKKCAYLPLYHITTINPSPLIFMLIFQDWNIK